MVFFSNVEKDSIEITYDQEYRLTVRFFLQEGLIERLPISISGKTSLTGTGWIKIRSFQLTHLL